MTGWDPAQYCKFAQHRLRPAFDLLAAIPPIAPAGATTLAMPGASGASIRPGAPATIIDLGCGDGRVTRVLADRWPDATITGVDNSGAMLAVAGDASTGGAVPEASGVNLLRADIARWRGAEPVDLLFSNAALHWIPDHATLFTNLIRSVRPGGVLAVQMPNNFDQPSHTAIHDAAAAGPWRERLAGLVTDTPVAAPAAYHAWLAPVASHLDIWQTTYLQVLEGENPVAEWTRGTWLKPFLDALEDADRAAFEANYRARVAAAYPRDAAGRTLFPFQRLFIVAVRGADSP